MKRRGVKDSDPYDWEKLDGNVQSVGSNVNSQNNLPSNIQSHIQLKTTEQIHANTANGSAAIGVCGAGNVTTQMTLGGTNNPSGIEYVSSCFVHGNWSAQAQIDKIFVNLLKMLRAKAVCFRVLFLFLLETFHL